MVSKNIFLNGELTEKVYMQSPPGYDHPPNKVSSSQSLVWSQTSTTCWFTTLSTISTQFHFSSISYDHALFICHSQHGSVFQLIYADDMIISGNDLQGIIELKNYHS